MPIPPCHTDILSMVIIHPYISIIYLESSPCPQDIPSNIGKPPHTLCPAVFDLLVIITAASLLANSLHTCVSALWVLYEGNSCALPTRPAGAFSSSYCTYYSQAFFTDVPSISLDSKLGRLGSLTQGSCCLRLGAVLLRRILDGSSWGQEFSLFPPHPQLPKGFFIPSLPKNKKKEARKKTTKKPFDLTTEISISVQSKDSRAREWPRRW